MGLPATNQLEELQKWSRSHVPRHLRTAARQRVLAKRTAHRAFVTHAGGASVPDEESLKGLLRDLFENGLPALLVCVISPAAAHILCVSPPPLPLPLPSCCCQSPQHSVPLDRP